MKKIFSLITLLAFCLSLSACTACAPRQEETPATQLQQGTTLIPTPSATPTPAPSERKSRVVKKDKNKKDITIYLNGKPVQARYYAHGGHYHLLVDGKNYLLSTKQFERIQQKDNDLVLKGRPQTHEEFEADARQNQLSAGERILSIEAHGDHWHVRTSTGREYVTYSDPNGKTLEQVKSKQNDHHHYHFDPKDVVSEDDYGYIVRHGDHYHYIPKEGTHIGLTSTPTPSPAPNSNSNASSTVTPTVSPSPYSQALLAKMNYISKVYGVPMEAIRISDRFFVFNTPGEDYDPTHVHPYAILIDQLIVPEFVGIPEIDFENELVAFATRIGKKAHQIQIRNGRFVLPHGDHEHYLNILNPEGMKAYYENLIPAPSGDYVPGAYEEETVKQKLAELEALAKDQLANDEVQLRRVLRALDEFRDVFALPTNSSEGYLQSLERFKMTYIEQSEKGDEDETEKSELSKRYDQLVEAISTLPLERYGQDKKNYIQALQDFLEQESVADFDRLERYLKAIQRVEASQSQDSVNIAYMHYLLLHIDSPFLSTELREVVSALLLENFASSVLHLDPKTPFKHQLINLVEVKQLVKEALGAGIRHEVVSSPAYDRLNHEQIGGRRKWAWRKQMTDFINEMAEFFVMIDQMNEEELADGVAHRLSYTPELYPQPSPSPTPEATPTPEAMPTSEPGPTPEVTSTPEATSAPNGEQNGLASSNETTVAPTNSTALVDSTVPANSATSTNSTSEGRNEPGSTSDHSTADVSTQAEEADPSTPARPHDEASNVNVADKTNQHNNANDEPNNEETTATP